jgi:hypothetical protein
LILVRGDAIKLANLVDVFKLITRKDPDPLAAQWADLLSKEAALPPPPPPTPPAP